MLKLAQLNGLEKWPGGGAFAHPAGLTRGAFEQILELGDGNLTAKFEKFKCPEGCRGAGVY